MTDNARGGGFIAGRAKVFHAMENLPRIFPYHGKLYADFSMVWKLFQKVFHGMEKRGGREIASGGGGGGRNQP
jgi:hypothetical protein